MNNTKLMALIEVLNPYWMILDIVLGKACLQPGWESEED